MYDLLVNIKHQKFCLIFFFLSLLQEKSKPSTVQVVYNICVNAFLLLYPPELHLFALQELCSFILSLVMQQCITMLTCSYHQQWMDREQHQQQQQKIVAASGKGRTISQLLSNNVFPSSIFCFMAYTYIHRNGGKSVHKSICLESLSELFLDDVRSSSSSSTKVVA